MLATLPGATRPRTDVDLVLGAVSVLVSLGVAGRHLAAGAPSAGVVAWNVTLPLLTCAFAVIAVRRAEGRILQPSTVALGVVWLGVVALMVRGRQLGIPVTWNLVWNVFLAWVPYVWSVLLAAGSTRARGLTWALAVCWLAFFPNAMYVVTDVVWLPRQAPGGAPFAYDVAVYLTAAFAGVALSFVSLAHVHGVVERLRGPRVGWAFAIVATVLSSIGVAMGRVVHRNSWDVVLRPSALARDVTSGLGSPFAVAAVLAGAALSLLAYAAWRRLFPGVARRPAGR